MPNHNQLCVQSLLAALPKRPDGYVDLPAALTIMAATHAALLYECADPQAALAFAVVEMTEALEAYAKRGDK